jgi:hypothetical protein
MDRRKLNPGGKPPQITRRNTPRAVLSYAVTRQRLGRRERIVTRINLAPSLMQQAGIAAGEHLEVFVDGKEITLRRCTSGAYGWKLIQKAPGRHMHSIRFPWLEQSPFNRALKQQSIRVVEVATGQITGELP